MALRTAAVSAIVAAVSCDRNKIVHRGDHLVTEYRQAAPANNMWEQLMLMKHSSGSANGVARRYDVAKDDSSSIADQTPRRARQSDLSVELADEAHDQKAGFWYSVLDFMMEGFALCATSSYPTMFPPLAPHPEQQRTLTAREISLRRWRGSPHPISSRANSSTANRGAPYLGFDRDAGQVTTDAYAVAFTDHGWREREREIDEAVAALSRLDDRTLQMLGIPHRSQIEQTVRYCHDC